ncbi:helix-turn-helix domain-containing protein [Labrenzia sp. 011]|uniref:GlxA family transcriptional regulator n=1 Tax=Labrenzia sp. 011 TaxID=2171494 RepID=UPI000D50A9EC|nr:helix-turn-helix domain-containing protein [Labrenzia sp. 011]PVB60420.1 GlxA family transcriptional regulator [Labrenzia sp. 011]
MSHNKPCQFAIILQPEFSLTTLTLAIEALRIANQNSAQNLFEWELLSEDGEEVRASNGMWFAAKCDFATAAQPDVCLLLQGNLPTQNLSKKLLGYLRRSSRFGAIVGGADSASYALAEAGLIATEKAPETILHWEAVPSFRELYPDAKPQNQIFSLSENRAQCAGGVATLDLMLELISRFVDEAMANEVANALIHMRRPGTTPQRGDQSFDGEDVGRSARIVNAMKENMDFPLTLEQLSRELGIPARTISRICKEAYNMSPMRLYLRIRLQAARNFLFYEEMSIGEVAAATGFANPSTFSRCFSSQFGNPPSTFRASLREKQKLKENPEIHRLIQKNDI